MWTNMGRVMLRIVDLCTSLADIPPILVLKEVRTTTWTEETKLYPSDPSKHGGFGRSVSLFDDTALIGVAADDDRGNNVGSVYVFTWNNTSRGESSTAMTWVEQTKLYASNATSADYFGASLPLHGNTALIGATGDDEKATNAGAVYVFTRQSSSSTGTVWTEQTKIYASDPAPEDGFGQSLSLHGDRALIGAYTDVNTTEINTGSVYEFVRSLLMSGGDIECAFAQTQVDCNALYTLETECNNQASCAWVEQERCDTAPAEKTAFNDYLASTTSERKQTDAVIAWCNAITTRKMHG